VYERACLKKWRGVCEKEYEVLLKITVNLDQRRINLGMPRAFMRALETCSFESKYHS
jgi:hypothetical protein